MIVRGLSGLMAAVFLLSAALQYNDPDPHFWMPIYGAAAAISAWTAFGLTRRQVGPAALVALVAFVWAATIVPRVAGQVGLGDMFSEFRMKTPVIEESRELAGLLAVGIWMAVVTLAARRARP